jgi:hypothetical protein
MGMLELSDENRKQAQSLKEFAEQPENRFVIGRSSFVPGDRSEYVRYLNNYRCVFTLTEHESRVFRHLSISVPAPNRLPHQMSAFTIATWFGFTGAPMQEDVATGPGLDWTGSSVQPRTTTA